MEHSKKEPLNAAGIIYAPHVLGAWLRAFRQKAGFSLRELEARSGVSDSEILKVETGAQDCRLVSFVRVCAALGVAAGYVLDNVVAGDAAIYSEKVLASPLYNSLREHFSRGASPEVAEGASQVVAENISQMVAFAAHLVRCTAPAARAQSMEYPSEKLKEAYCRFAAKLEVINDPLERLSILTALQERPFSEMGRNGLFTVDMLEEVMRAMVSEGKKEIMGGRAKRLFGWPVEVPVWDAFLPSDAFMAQMEGKKELTTGYGQRNNPSVKSPMQVLLGRMARVVKLRGKKAELAAHLKVPRPRVSEWLHGAGEPSGEVTLRLLEWVTAEEAKQKQTPGGATNTAKGETRLPKDKDEKR